MEKGRIIFLNGTSSSGKTSISKKIQEISEEKYYHVSFDTFLLMLNEKFWNMHSAGIIMKRMNNFILDVCRNGENVIFDTVFFIGKDSESMIKECIEAFEDIPFTFVKVNCPLEELERRELERGDRQVGLAKGQFESMHEEDIYDIEVNTYENTSEECSKVIINHIEELLDESKLKKKYSV